MGCAMGSGNTASKEASMFLDQVWDGIKTGSLACLFAVGIYCMVVGAITTVDQLAAHITAGCEKGGQAMNRTHWHTTAACGRTRLDRF